MKTVTTLAAEVADMFVREVRGQETEARLFIKEEHKTKESVDSDGHPYNWVTQMVLDAPDCNLEESYEEVYGALLHIADSSAEDVDDLDEQEADIYTSDLIAWLAADVSRLSDADDAREELGATTFESAIQCAQSEWRRSITAHVWETLESQLEDDEDSADEDNDE